MTTSTTSTRRWDPDLLGAFPDDELASEALAADPDQVVGEEAVPVWELTGQSGPGAKLPAWYMPAPMPGAPLLRGWRRRVILLVIASFLVINAYGLCNTYGSVAFG